VGLVYGHPIHFSDQFPPSARLKPTSWTIWPGQQWLADRCKDGLNVITSPEVLMRKSVVDKIGGQQPLDHTHDMEMWLRLAAFSDVTYIHGADQAWHRDHAASMSARKVDTYRDLIERQKAFQCLFAGMAGAFPESPALFSASMHAIASQAIEAAISDYGRGVTDRRQLERYLAIARESVPNIEKLPGWSALQKWISIDPNYLIHHPQFLMRRANIKFRSLLSWRRWHQNGVF
jgi:hypothetical protein